MGAVSSIDQCPLWDLTKNCHRITKYHRRLSRLLLLLPRSSCHLHLHSKIRRSMDIELAFDFLPLGAADLEKDRFCLHSFLRNMRHRRDRLAAFLVENFCRMMQIGVPTSSSHRHHHRQLSRNVYYNDDMSHAFWYA